MLNKNNFLPVILVFVLTLLRKPSVISSIHKSPCFSLDLMVKLTKLAFTTVMALFGDTGAILNPIVPSSYYGMLRGQIHIAI